jgi:hypothetical protein
VASSNPISPEAARDIPAYWFAPQPDNPTPNTSRAMVMRQLAGRFAVWLRRRTQLEEKELIKAFVKCNLYTPKT